MVRVTVAVCDNPACTTRREHSREEPAIGLHLKGMQVDGTGGWPLDIYACSEECLSAAQQAVKARVLGWDEDRS